MVLSYQGMTFPWGKGVGNGCGLGEHLCCLGNGLLLGFSHGQKILKIKQQDDKFIYCVT
jgi:hypothetical protein